MDLELSTKERRTKKILSLSDGLEPSTYRLTAERATDCATKALWPLTKLRRFLRGAAQNISKISTARPIAKVAVFFLTTTIGS